MHHRVSGIAFLFLSALTAAISTPAVAVDQLVYSSLAQPCRLLDTRSPGPGAFTAAHGTYLLGSSNADIESVGQNGNAAGCAIPAGVSAISVNFNMFNATAAGNILTWASGATTPAAGTAVYNPSNASPMPGQVLYNTGFATIAVGAADGRFNLSVANGQMDMTINIVGYWNPINSQSTVTGFSAFSIGYDNLVSGEAAAAIGESNSASGFAGMAFGMLNSAGGSFSAAIGGQNATVGPGSIAMGNDARANAPLGGQFVFGDGTAVTTSTTSLQFVARASNGFIFYTHNDNSTGLTVAPGGGSWTSLSDRNSKRAVELIDTRNILDRVAALPLSTWQYKSQDAKYRHMGPMAQDFYAAFGLGESDTGIDTIDADGVALAAIQGLKSELDEKDRQMKDALGERDRKIAELSAQVAELASAIKRTHGN